LQLDVGAKYALEVKRELARRMAVRDLGEGSVWNAAVNDPVPAAVLSVETRRGRPPEQRARLASALIDACSEALDLNPEVLAVELTQHAGDENLPKVLRRCRSSGRSRPRLDPGRAAEVAIRSNEDGSETQGIVIGLDRPGPHAGTLKRIASRGPVEQSA
jgi:hypothetical protein